MSSHYVAPVPATTSALQPGLKADRDSANANAWNGSADPHLATSITATTAATMPKHGAMVAAPAQPTYTTSHISDAAASHAAPAAATTSALQPGPKILASDNAPPAASVTTTTTMPKHGAMTAVAAAPAQHHAFTTTHTSDAAASHTAPFHATKHDATATTGTVQPGIAAAIHTKPDASSLSQHEAVEQKLAVKRTEVIEDVAHRVAAGEPLSKGEIIHGMDKASNQLELAQQLAHNMNKPAGEQTLRDARDVVEASRALAVERSGLAEKTHELAVESYKAAQAATQGARTELEGKDVKTALGSKIAPTADETNQMRSAAERLLSMLKMLVTSSEGRGIMLEMSGMLKQVFHVMGGALEDATDTVTQGAVAAARDEHIASGGSSSTATTGTTTSSAGTGAGMMGGTHAAHSGMRQAGTGTTGTGIAATTTTGSSNMTHTTSAFPGSAPTTTSAEGKWVDIGGGEMKWFGAGAGMERKAATTTATTTTATTTTATAGVAGAGAGGMGMGMRAGATGTEAPKTMEAVGDKLKMQMEQKKEELSDTKDQLEQTIKRVMSLMVKIAGNPGVRTAVQDMVEIARDYQSRIKLEGKEVVSAAASTGHGSAAQSHAEKAANLAVEVMRELAPGDILDRIAQQARDILNLFVNNETLSVFWENLTGWFFEMLDNPELIERQESTDKLKEFIQDGKDTWREVNAELEPKMNEMSNLLEQLFNTLKDDKHLMELESSVNRLAADLFTTDSTGRPHLKMEAISDLRSLIAPLMANALRYIAVPPINYSDKTYDLQAADLVLRSDELLPDSIKLYAETMIDVKMANMSSSQELGRFTIFIRGVRIEAKAFKFFFKRKSFPKFKDEGHCDCVTIGKGVDIDISFREQATHPFLSAPRARCHIDKLKIKLHKDTHHRSLVNFLTSAFRGTIEKAIQNSVQQAIEENGLMLAEKINAQLFAWSSSLPASSKWKKRLGGGGAIAPADTIVSHTKPSTSTTIVGSNASDPLYDSRMAGTSTSTTMDHTKAPVVVSTSSVASFSSAAAGAPSIPAIPDAVAPVDDHRHSKSSSTSTSASHSTHHAPTHHAPTHHAPTHHALAPTHHAPTHHAPTHTTTTAMPHHPDLTRQGPIATTAAVAYPAPAPAPVPAAAAIVPVTAAIAVPATGGFVAPAVTTTTTTATPFPPAYTNTKHH